LSLTDFSQVDFAARLTSVGLIEGIRADSSKILEHTSSVILLTDANATVYENNAVTGSLLDGVNLPGSNTVTDWTGGALGQVVDLWSDGDQIATLRVDGDGNYVLDASAGDELSDGEEIRFDYTFAARNQDESTSWSTDSAAFIVKVIGVNDGPDAQDDEGGEVLEGQVLVGDVTGNDSDVDRLDTHVWTLMDGSFTGQGLVTLNPDGTWTFDSQGAYAGMVDGERQELSFQYVMTDNHGASDVATVTFYVNGDGSGGGGGGGGGGGDDDPPPLGNDFPTWGQDISNITLIFMQTAGDIKPLSDGDGYYTVKVNVDSAFNDDLDASIDQLISDLVAYDANLDPNPDLYGVVIKGGLQTTLFYAYGDYNFNGDATDTLPGDLGFVLPGDNANVSPTHAIDAGYNYTALILS
jgi:VCBS repeat-containing protein